MKWSGIITLITLTLSSCISSQYVLPYGKNDIPTTPNYSDLQNWAALPSKVDNADKTPDPSLKDLQNEAQVDVFFLHPTTYTRKRKKLPWNAALEDIPLNEKTDNTTILHQASIFNGAGKVYAPRYRQAHLSTYFTKDKQKAKEAFDLAYTDIKKAFEYYLNNFNQGRPIIIASHSQGTTHTKRLLKAFFDGKPLQQQLVAAYIVGIPVAEDEFKHLKPCQTPEETGCFCAWRTYKRNYFPPDYKKNNEIVATNPLLWTIKPIYAARTLNEGGVLTRFNRIKKQITDAQVHNGLLWARKPRFFGRLLLIRKNYHIGDFNLYYVNIRNNAILRSNNFLKQQTK